MLAKFTRIIKHYKLPILAGVLIGTSYIPFPPWASFFCFIPLWRFWLNEKDKNLKQILISGWITGFVLTLIGFNWIIYTIHEFGHFPWPVAFLGLLAFCSFANLDIALAGALWWWLNKKLKLSRPVSMALIPIIYCFFKAYFPTIFSWNYGYTLFWAKLPMYQLAELIGFQGLSSLVILFNFAIWRALDLKIPAKRRYALASILAGLLILNIAGWGLKKLLPEPDREARFLVTQANIGNLEKYYAEKGWGFQDFILKRYLAVTKSGIEKFGEDFDFVLWPETAFPANIVQSEKYNPYLEQLKLFARENNKTLLTGGYYKNFSSDKIANSFMVIEPDGFVRENPYSKIHLLVFGEYIPFADRFPILKQWIPAGDFARGKGLKLESFGELKIGPQICYESLFPEFTRGLAQLGAQIIVNLTNDSWYGTWQEPYQHLYMTLARGIEVRRPLVRATNTGISAAILADGTVLDSSPMNVEWSGLYVVPFSSQNISTFYQNYPWLMDAILLALGLILIGKACLGQNRKP